MVVVNHCVLHLPFMISPENKYEGISGITLKQYDQLIMSLCARQKDVNACARQKNWQCEDFACSQQKDVNDKTCPQFNNPITIVNTIAGYDILRPNLAWYEIQTNKTYKW